MQLVCTVANSTCCRGSFHQRGFKQKYRLDHPGNHLNSIILKTFPGSKYPEKKNVILKTEALASPGRKPCADAELREGVQQ